jgi:hypothetical protein
MKRAANQALHTMRAALCGLAIRESVGRHSCVSLVVGPTVVRALVYSGLAALGGAACVTIAAIMARAAAPGVPSFIGRYLAMFCWFGFGLGVIGTLGGIIARSRLPQKVLCTLVISVSVGIALLALYLHVTALPGLVGEPMLLDLSRSGPTNGLSQ